MGIAYETPDRPQYSAKRMVKQINFFFLGPEAESVYLMGDFNDWNPTSHPMQWRKDGWWSLQVPLNHGHHQYLSTRTPQARPGISGTRRYRSSQ